MTEPQPPPDPYTDVPPEEGQVRVPVQWRFWDIVLALVLGFVGGAVVLGIVFAIAPDIEDLGSAQWLLVAGGTIYASELLMAWLIVLRRRGATFRDIGLTAPTIGAVLLMIPAILGVFIVEGTVAQLTTDLFGPTPTAQDQLLGEGANLDNSQLPYVFLLTVVLAPIVEELIFRGIVYGYLRSRMRVAWAVPLSGVIFAGFHFIPLLIPALFVLGCALALVYERYDSIVVPMALHALNNGIVIWALYATL